MPLLFLGVAAELILKFRTRSFTCRVASSIAPAAEPDFDESLSNMTLLQDETATTAIGSIPTELNLASTGNGTTTFDTNSLRNSTHPVMLHPQTVNPNVLMYPPLCHLNAMTQRFIHFVLQAENLQGEEILKLFNSTPTNKELLSSYVDGLCPVATTELTHALANTFGVRPDQDPRPSGEASVVNHCHDPPWDMVPSPIPQEIQALIDAYIFGKPLTVIVSRERLCERWSLNLPETYGYVVMGFYRIIGVEVRQTVHCLISPDDF